jgi:RimJ/RimL family protein N-acetyltransferase
MNDMVYLRALEIDDYKTSVKWRNDPEIDPKIGGPKYFVSSEYEKRWVENQIFNSGDDVVLAICVQKTNEYIGNVYIRNINWINRSAESSILIGNKDFWGKGIALEALKLILEFAFYERNLERITALILESNTISLKLHEKCGYKKEGLLRNAIYKDGRFQNQYILSVLRSDFENVFS